MKEIKVKKRSLVGVAAMALLMSLTATACGEDDDCDESTGAEFAPMAMVDGKSGGSSGNSGGSSGNSGSKPGDKPKGSTSGGSSGGHGKIDLDDDCD
jgi:uncharacterized membrane protein YgcG